ncbi:MAG: YqaE/Pmp3 family membrane protein [Saprospiraceae bacterium]|nr:YqaE/Pmp3 family membrane protein [Saprospiraceae bacterium]
MKLFTNFFVLALIVFASFQSYAVVNVTGPTTQEAVKLAKENGLVLNNFQNVTLDQFTKMTPKEISARIGHKLSFKETVALKLAQKKFKNMDQDEKKGLFGDDNKILILILCIFIPPVAVYMVHGVGSKFWVNVLLTLLCGLPGIIHALIVCKGSY